MRKLHIIIMAISCLLLTTCMKDKEITPLEINVGVWESTSDYVVIVGEYNYETELHDFYLLYDENPDFSSAESVKMDVEGKSIDAEIRDLQAETTYYYYVECKTKYSSMRTDVETFETDKGNITPDIPEEPEEPEIPGDDPVSLPTVTTNDVSNITTNSAICGGNVTSDGNATVIARGICWSTSQNPTISNNHTTDGNGTGSFTSSITGLTANTTYYVRAYVTNEKKTVYGEQRSFTTLDLENQVVNVNGVCFTMIAVKGGTFNMGAQSTDPSGTNYDGDAFPSEEPVHSVTLSDYYIGETEVTQELWEAVMGSNPSNSSGNQKPVEKVSWNDCKEFIEKLNQLTGKNFRLPTEAEWEYAARGGNKSKGYKYSGSNTIGNVAWYKDNSASATHNVKTKSPNELGIYDMSGNVMEWCEDWYGNYSSGSQTNPAGPSTGSRRLTRGGGWYLKAGYCRVSDRFEGIPGGNNFSLGLRLCLSQY